MRGAITSCHTHFHGVAAPILRLGPPPGAQFRRREGWVPRREGKNHCFGKLFPGVMLSFYHTNLGTLITLATQAHRKELIFADVS
jgi:hypothetical protein